MRRVNWLLWVLVCLVGLGFVSEVDAQTYYKRQGYCQRPAQRVTTNGATSTTTVMQIVPGCTVTVYPTGLLSLASLYSTNSGTVRANPVTADANGYYWYYAEAGRYDERFSGGTSPNNFPSPVTLVDVVIAPASSAPALTPVGGLGAVQLDNGAGLLDGDSGVRVDLNNMLLRIGRSGFTGKLSLYNTNGFATTIQSGSQSQNWTWTLPTGTPSTGQALFVTGVSSGVATTAWQTPSPLRIANLGSTLTQRGTVNIGGVQIDGDGASAGIYAADNATTGQTDVLTKGIPTKWRNLVTDYNASPDATLITGSISSGSSSLTVSGNVRWKVGQGILVAGAGVSGANLITTVSAINGFVFTLAAPASSTVTGVTVQHDNSLALQQAVDSKLNVTIPQGDYLVGAKVTLPGDISEGFPLRIQGAGPGATKILNQTTDDLFVAANGDDVANIIFEDLTVGNTTLGNPYTTSLATSDGYAFNLIDASIVNQFHLKNVLINGFRGALACANCQNGIVEKITIREFKTCAICLVSPETVFVGAAESNVTAIRDGLIELGLYAADSDVALTGISWLNGSKTLGVSSATFSATDKGKWVRITNAGQTGGDVIAMIRTVNSSTSVTLSAPNNSGANIVGGTGTMYKTNIATLWLHRASQGVHENLTLQGNWSNAITGHNTSAVRIEGSNGVTFRGLWVEESGGQGGPDLYLNDSNNVTFTGYHSNADTGLWPGSHSSFAKLVNTKAVAISGSDLVSSVSPFDVDTDSSLQVDNSYLGYPVGRFVTGYQNVVYGENVTFRLNGAEAVGNGTLNDTDYGEQFVTNPRYDDNAGVGTGWTQDIPSALTFTNVGTGRLEKYVTVNRQGAGASTSTNRAIGQVISIPNDAPAGWWSVAFNWRIEDFGTPRVSCGSSGGGEVFVTATATGTGAVSYPNGSALGLRWSNSQCDGTPSATWFRSNLRVYVGTGTGRTITVGVYTASGPQTPSVSFTNWRVQPGKHASGSYDQPVTRYKGGVIESGASLIFVDAIGGGTRTVCVTNSGTVTYGICGGGGGGGGTGDVVGPSSATDNAAARFDLTTGKLIQNSVVLIGDTGNVSGVGTLNTHTIPGGTDTFTLNAATQTLTNKSISGSSNTITNVSLTTGVTGILPVANGGTGLSSLASGIATWWTTPSSANLAAVVTDETGSGQVVFNTQPALDKPVLTSYVFSALPTPATNMLAIVTDCANTACSSGGGSTVRFMRYNGSAWAVLGDGDSGGTPAFSSITAGTNTAALLIGTGGSLGVTGSGTIAATSVTGLSVTAGKTLTVSNSITLVGTDTTTMTFPNTSGSVLTADSTNALTNKTFNTAGTGNTFQINGTGITAVSGSGAVALVNGATFIAPVLGAATATSINKVAITAPATGATLALSDGSTLATSGGHSLTFTTAGATNVTLPTSGTLVNSAVTTLSSLASVGTISSGTWQGTVVELAYGGTGRSLADPNANRIMFWDDTNNRVDWLTIGTNLSITGTTLNASGGGGGSSSTGTGLQYGDGVGGFSEVTNSSVSGGAVTLNPSTTPSRAFTLGMANRSLDGQTDSHRFYLTAKGRSSSVNHTSEILQWIDISSDDASDGRYRVQQSYDSGTATDLFTADAFYGLTSPFLSIFDSNASNRITLLTSENTTSDYNLDYRPNGANRTIDLSGNLTLGAGLTTTTAAITLAANASGSSVTLPISGTLATLAGSETLTNKTLTTPIISSISNTGTLTLPASTDTLVGRATTDTLTNKSLDVEGTGNTLTTVSKMWIDAAGYNAGTGISNMDLPSSNAPSAAAITGTNVMQGVLDFPDGATDLVAQRTYHLSSDWTGTIDVKYKWLSSTTSGNVVWGIAIACVADGVTNDPALTYNDVTDATKGTANQTNDATYSNITTTGSCAAGSLMHISIARRLSQAADTMAGTARLIGVELTLRRAQ